MPRVLALLILLGGLNLAAAEPREPADPMRWTIDSSQSQAQFRVRLLAILPLSGSFEAIQGAIVFDPRRGAALVEAELRSDSLRMRKDSHTAWARSADFFDAANYPLIRFRSDSFPQQALRDGGRIEGELTLRGITRSVTFKVEPGQCDPLAATRCTVDVAGLVRRSEFGMKTNPGTVGDWVSLRLHIVAAQH